VSESVKARVPLTETHPSSALRSSYPVMSSQEPACYTVVYEDSSEAPSTQDLRNALQKGSDEVKIDAMRKIIVLTINGNAQVCQTTCTVDPSMLRWLHDALLAAAAHAYNPILYAVAQ
jgi:hypothetical protein